MALTRDQTDGRLVMIEVVIADSRWSSNDGGGSHGRLAVYCVRRQSRNARSCDARLALHSRGPRRSQDGLDRRSQDGLDRRSQDGMRWCSKKDKRIMAKK